MAHVYTVLMGTNNNTELTTIAEATEEAQFLVDNFVDNMRDRLATQGSDMPLPDDRAAAADVLMKALFHSAIDAIEDDVQGRDVGYTIRDGVAVAYATFDRATPSWVEIDIHTGAIEVQ